jgi:uncharacterized membrane protein YqjE
MPASLFSILLIVAIAVLGLLALTGLVLIVVHDSARS